MIIKGMYNTQIKVYSEYTDENNNTPSYNFNIDETADIVVTIKDFNGNPVVDEPVTLYYDNTVMEGITNSNGIWVYKNFTCSEWGLHTFSTNDANTQIRVKGFKLVQSLASDKIKVYANEEYVQVRIVGTFTVQANKNDQLLATLDSAYRAPHTIVATAHQSNTLNKIAIAGPSVFYYNFTSNTSQSTTAFFMYPKP